MQSDAQFLNENVIAVKFEQHLKNDKWNIS